jgi:hypothetical protein
LGADAYRNKKSRIVGNDPNTASFDGTVGLDFGIVCVVAAFWLPADPSKRSRKASEFFLVFFFPQNREAKKKKRFMSAFFCVAEKELFSMPCSMCAGVVSTGVRLREGEEKSQVVGAAQALFGDRSLGRGDESVPAKPPECVRFSAR